MALENFLWADVTQKQKYAVDIRIKKRWRAEVDYIFEK